MSSRPVVDILRERFPRSMELAVLTLLIAASAARSRPTRARRAMRPSAGRLHDHRHPGPRHGHRRSFRRLPHRLHEPGRQQLRSVRGPEGGRSGRPPLRESNRDKRKQLYWELQRYLLAKGDHASIAVGWVEGWFFKDEKLRNYKPGLTVYDNNTFMKTWIAP